MPHKNWRFGTLSASTPLRHDPESPSSPCSPLHPIRPRPTASSRFAPLLSASTQCVGSLQHKFPLVSPFGQISTPSTSSTTTNSSSSRTSGTSGTLPNTTPSTTSSIPPTPQPWQWKCHLCSRRYNLGTTRCCLEDGHIFCSRPATSSSHPLSVSSPPLPPRVFATRMEELLHEKAKRKREKKQAKENKRRESSCKSEFDYGGWERWNLWRCYGGNENGGGIGDEFENSREERDCWNQCVYPSECLQKIHLAAEAAREKLAKEEEEKEWSTMVYWSETKLKDEQKLVLPEWKGESFIVDHTAEEEMLGMEVYAPFEFEFEDGNRDIMKVEYTNDPPEDLYIETEHLEYEKEPAVGIDLCTGLSIEMESAFAQLCKARRKSGDDGPGGSNKVPSSPLKSCFGFEEVDLGNVGMGDVID